MSSPQSPQNSVPFLPDQIRGISFEWIDAADGFATNPNSYTPFLGTEDVDCFDPRARKGLESQDVVIQTGGGEAGRAHDRALVHTVLTGEFVPIQQALSDPVDDDRTGRGHRDHCKFLGARAPMLERLTTLGGWLMHHQEVAHPRSTEANIRTGLWLGWYAGRHNIEVGDMTWAANEVAKAAPEHRKELAATQLSQNEILALVDNRFPDAENVFNMEEDDVVPDVLVTNHTDWGLKRDKMHRKGVRIFNDSLGMMVQLGLEEADRMGLSGRHRALFVAAPIMRSSETLNQLDLARAQQGQPPLRHYQSTLGQDGRPAFSGTSV